MAQSNSNKDDEVLREELFQRLIDAKLVTASAQIGFHGDPKKLALRELPHGCWSNVFLLYQAHCRTQGETPASKSTFFSVAQHWRCALRFHKKTQHQICVTCSRLKMLIRHAADTFLQLKAL